MKLDYKFHHNYSLSETCSVVQTMQRSFYSPSDRIKYMLILFVPIVIVVAVSVVVGKHLTLWIDSNLFSIRHSKTLTMISVFLPIVAGSVIGLKLLLPRLTNYVNSLGAKHANLEDVPTEIIITDEDLTLQSATGRNIVYWSGVSSLLISKSNFIFVVGYQGYYVPRHSVGEKDMQVAFLEDMQTKVDNIVYIK